MNSLENRILAIGLALLLPIQMNPFSIEESPQYFPGVPGEPYGLNVTTDKYRYDIGEDVTVIIKNEGNHSLYWPCLDIFWYIFDEEWKPVKLIGPMCLTVVVGLSPGSHRNETWNQTYYLLDEQSRIIPPTWEQVPPGLYHANTSIYCPDCEANLIVLNGTAEFIIGKSGPVADAGGPYVGYEGQELTFDASNSTGTSLQYRWDFDNDGTWDSGWSSSPKSSHTYGDDYDGLAKVEVKESDLGIDIDHMYPDDFFSTVNHWIEHAQSFVPSKSVLSAVDLDIGINWGAPEDLLYITIRSTLEGANLTQISVEPSNLHDWCSVEGEHLDFPDISVNTGETYWILVTSPQTVKTGNYHICGTNTDYPGGSQWIWTPSDGWENLTQYGYYDLRFRTYSGGPTGEQTSNATAQINILNVAPSLSLKSIPPQAEGDTADLEVTVVDPGSDDLSLSWWGECAGWQSSSILFPNNPTVIPDPYPSLEINPRNVVNIQSIQCGDNGDFQWNVQAVDDDGGITTMSGTVTFANVPPEYAQTFCPQIVGCLPARLEGESTSYWVILGDPGSDDVGLEWTWGDGSSQESVTHYNDGIGPDPPNSPNGTYPFPVEDTRNHSYGDNGKYTISVVAEDDDGGVSPISADVTIQNVAPSLTVSPPQFLSVEEGVEVTLQATATDPGSDDLTFTWSWEYGKTESQTYYNNGVGPDPPDSPLGTFPFTASGSSSHTHGDDCKCVVSLVVEDDDGSTVTYTTTVDVINVPPSVIEGVQVYAKGDLTLRVAGEKWHDVSLKLYDDGTEIASASVVREPGSPNDQSVTIEEVVIDLLNDRLSAVIEYTPLDDPINGQINGANPAWLIFTPHNGGEASWLHHTFNVKHPETWIWTIDDLGALLIGVGISFEASATDPGSDDLTFTWDWGDSTSTSTTYYNDGIGPDPYPSPDVNPITVTDQQLHAFMSAGTYTIMLSIEDDDGSACAETITLTI